MNKLIQLTMVGALALTVAPQLADAGRGGSAARIENAIRTGSSDAIIAEVERAEHLVCPRCVDLVTGLLEHRADEVREVAGWWFAKRPSLAAMMTDQMLVDLTASDAQAIQFAADYLGAVKAVSAVDELTAAYAAAAGEGGAVARQAIVRAVGRITHRDGRALLNTAMTDAAPTVRIAALEAWLAVRNHDGTAIDAGNAPTLLADTTPAVRAKAASLIGNLRDARGRVTLEALVTSDADPLVRRNAAWALGRLGDRASRPALEAAAQDSSGLVRRVAAAALSSLR